MNGCARVRSPWAGICLALALPNCAARAQQTPDSASTPTAPSFANFELVTQRNIFDSQRVTYRAADASPTPPPVVVERIGLLGTLIDGAERVAFIQGTSGTYSGAFHPGDKIEDLVVSQISTDGVRIADTSRTLELAVGSSLERRGGEAWQLAQGGFVATPAPSSAVATASAETSASSSASSAAAPSSSSLSTANAPPGATPTPAPSGSGSTDDILKRLMERRQREAEK